MANLVQSGRRPSILGLRRDIDDLVEEFGMPRALRREIEQAFEDFSAPRSLWLEMDRLMDDFVTPPTLRRRIERLFENVLGTSARRMSRAMEQFMPKLDLVEHDNDYTMRVDLPGVREQDVDVSIDDNNMLTIRAERREEEHKNVSGYEYNERRYGSFVRSIALPQGIDASKIDADFRNGVLEVHVPKGEAMRARKIPVGREEPRVMGAGGNGGTVQPQRS